MTSKIKVDNITDQDDNNIINESGDVITVGAAGDTVAVAGNIVKSNTLQASDGGNIVNQSGTTITLGASGDTVSLASGASQTGFGRSGSVDWNTTKKTADFTATNGAGFFVDTNSGTITATLPASPSAGDIVYIKDYQGTFGSNTCTIARNGSNIRGSASNFTLSKNNAGAVFIYVDATEGWQVFADGSNDDVTETFVCATGGTVTCSGSCRIHTFTGPGTFTVNTVNSCAANNVVSYLVVAGGGGGGGNDGGGGGAGGFREDKSPVTPYTASPRDGAGAITVSAQGYPVTVGGGGAAGAATTQGTDGNSSTVFSKTSAGGGGGGSETSGNAGRSGGSGGGASTGGGTSGSGGAGNTPSESPPQGNSGGNGPGTPGFISPPARGGGGGGGILGAGSNGTTPGVGGPGGAHANTSINGSDVEYAGGGGAGGRAGGAPGGGGGAGDGVGTSGTGGAGTANTGGGGGGAGEGASGSGAGGSGVVIIRYKFQ
jgi:hypothetical protein